MLNRQCNNITTCQNFHHTVGSRGGPGGGRGEAAGGGAKGRTTLAEPPRWGLGEARVGGWGRGEDKHKHEEEDNSRRVESDRTCSQSAWPVALYRGPSLGPQNYIQTLVEWIQGSYFFLFVRSDSGVNWWGSNARGKIHLCVYGIEME